MKTAFAAIKAICKAIEQLREKTGSKQKVEVRKTIGKEMRDEVAELTAGINEVLAIRQKKERDRRIGMIRERLFAKFEAIGKQGRKDLERHVEQTILLRMAWKELLEQEMKRSFLTRR